MGVPFNERLARLRRDAARPAAGASPDPEPASAPPPAWWTALRKRSAPSRTLDAARDAECGPPAELREIVNERGRYALREQRVALESSHGSSQLLDVLRARPGPIELVTKDPRLAELDPTRALFLDIETTGLAGGAGTKAFLVGLAWIERGELVVWQGFLNGPEQEASLLHDVAERIRGCGALVSFFGKSFDRHRLEDKMRVHRIEPPFEGRPHLDLYHPLRALYRPALADARLGTLEAALCGVRRVDDLSGAFAPQAWYDFLAGRPHRLERVFAHNRDDVLSLVTLLAHLGALELAPRSHPDADDSQRRLEIARLRGLARALAHGKRWRECAELTHACLALSPPAELCAELEALGATALRRLRRASSSERPPRDARAR